MMGSTMPTPSDEDRLVEAVFAAPDESSASEFEPDEAWLAAMLAGAAERAQRIAADPAQRQYADAVHADAVRLSAAIDSGPLALRDTLADLDDRDRRRSVDYLASDLGVEDETVELDHTGEHLSDDLSDEVVDDEDVLHPSAFVEVVSTMIADVEHWLTSGELTVRSRAELVSAPPADLVVPELQRFGFAENVDIEASVDRAARTADIACLFTPGEAAGDLSGQRVRVTVTALDGSTVTAMVNDSMMVMLRRVHLTDLSPSDLVFTVSYERNV